MFDGEESSEDGALVLVEDRTIVGVEGAWVEDPPGCVVREVSGTLLPGLIDTHVHLCADSRAGALDRLPDYADGDLPAVIEEGLRRHLAAGVTTVRDLGDRRLAVVDWVRAHADDVVGPTVLTAGPPITSVGGHCWNMGGEVAGRRGCARAVRERVERGIDVVKIMTSGGFATPGTEVMRCQFTAEEVRLIVDEAHRQGLPVTGHAHGLPAVRQCIAGGVDGIEHCSCLTETGMELTEDILVSLRAADIVVCPTLGQVSAMAPPPAIAAMLQKQGISIEEALRQRRESGARFVRAGVRLVAGTDGGIGEAKPHGLVPLGLRDLVSGGLTPIQALATATSASADALRLGGRKGRLRVGADADLLVVDGNPLVDIEALQRVTTVYLAGQELTGSAGTGSPSALAR